MYNIANKTKPKIHAITTLTMTFLSRWLFLPTPMTPMLINLSGGLLVLVG